MSLIDNRAKIISKNKFGTIVIEVFNWDNLFHYCNTIAESGKVDFCEPVFPEGSRRFNSPDSYSCGSFTFIRKI